MLHGAQHNTINCPTFIRNWPQVCFIGFQMFDKLKLISELVAKLKPDVFWDI